MQTMKNAASDQGLLYLHRTFLDISPQNRIKLIKTNETRHPLADICNHQFDVDRISLRVEILVCIVYIFINLLMHVNFRL